MRIPVNIQEYVELLDSRVRFIQANYGDGEWACILGHPGENCNGEHYIEPLRIALTKTITKPPAGHVWYGSNPGKKLSPSVEHWLLEKGLTQRAWVYKEIISGANANGKLGPFIDAVRRRNTVLVGPRHLQNEDISRIWNVKAQTIIPISDAYLAHDRTIQKCQTMIKDYDPELILFCAGMAANPLMYQLADEHGGITMIDMGATLDPYAGVWSRNAYRKEEFQQTTFAKNLKDLPA